MCVYVCACVCVRASVRWFVCVYTHTHIHTYIHTHINADIYTNTHISVVKPVATDHCSEQPPLIRLICKASSTCIPPPVGWGS